MGIEEQIGDLLDRIEELEAIVGRGVERFGAHIDSENMSLSEAIDEIAPDGPRNSPGIRKRWF